MKQHRNPRQRLSKPPTPDNAAEPTPERDRAVRARTIADGLNDLRETIGRTDALANAVVRVYDERAGGEDDPRVEERVSYLIDCAAASAAKALMELDQFREELEAMSSAEGADERS